MTTQIENLSELVQQWAHDPGIARSALRQLLPLVVSQDESVREWANEALENCGTPLETDVHWLVEQTTSTEVDIVYWACTLLGRLGEKANHYQVALVRVLDGTYPSPSLSAKQRAAWALARTGPLTAESRKSLSYASKGPDIKLASLAILALEAKF